MMINFLKYIFGCNFLLLNLNFKKIKKKEYDYDFSNLSFVDYKENKNILLKDNLKYNKKNNQYYNYHSFSWLKIAKDAGGSKIVKITRDKVLNWINKNHKFIFYITNFDLSAKRMINLIFHYDFFGSSANDKDKIKIKFVIYCHYIFLKKYLTTSNKIFLGSIEITKAILLYETIHNINTVNIIIQIQRRLRNDIDQSGLHFSMSPQLQAEYINHLIEIKNILLYFKIIPPKEVEFQIINMISVLKNFIHKDNSLSYFNGSSNYYCSKIFKIFEYENDIKIKNLTNNKNGFVSYENKNLKIIFDVVYPHSKLINLGLHSSTLSFELSIGKEKIISNCGSLNQKNNKNLNYFRYSAAHSTIILNNTNIFELTKNKSYKRIPKKIDFEKKESTDELFWKASHDGYLSNFKKIIKREIKINKINNFISGNDQIISFSLKKDRCIFNIRFHLTPLCKAVLTRGKMSAIIKTNESSFIFKSNNEINIEESIFVDNLNKIVKTSQIVISGFCNNSKKNINWSLSKY